MAQKMQVKFRGEILGSLIPGEVTMDEGQQLEDTAGMTYNEMVMGVDRASAKATRALVWFLRLRKGEPADLWANFTFGDVEVEVLDIPDPTKAAKSGKKGSAPSAQATSDSETDDSGTSPSSPATST